MICRKVPIYNVDTYFFTDRAEAREFVRAHDPGQVSAVDDCKGVVLELAPPGAPRLRCLCVFNGDRNTVIHEAVHMAWATLAHCNIRVTFRNDEVLAYLTEYFANEMMEILAGAHE